MPRTVLLCDDDSYVLRDIEFKLRHAGYQVQLARDGAAAWERIRQEPPDLLVADRQLPLLDGLQLACRVHHEPATRGLPVIVLTDAGFELSYRALRDEYGILAVFSKPFRPRVLVERIQLLLAESTAAPPRPARGLATARRRTAGHVLEGRCRCRSTTK